MEDLRFFSRRIHLVRKKDSLNYTTNAQPITMIANSGINENGIIFADSFLVVPVSFVKNQSPCPSPLPFFETSIVTSKRGRRIGNYVNL